MTKKIFVALAFVGLIATACTSVAEIDTVSEVTKNSIMLDKKDIKVTLTGCVLEQIKKGKFLFEDATGQIVIDVDNKHLDLIPLDPEEEIQIIGTVDCDFEEKDRVEFDVDKIILE